MPSPVTLRINADELARAADEATEHPERLLAIELTKEPAATETYKLVVSAGDQKEEHEGLTPMKGRDNIVTKVNAASKLIKIEETGA